MDVLLFLLLIAFYIQFLRTRRAAQRHADALEQRVAALAAEVAALKEGFGNRVPDATVQAAERAAASAQPAERAAASAQAFEHGAASAHEVAHDAASAPAAAHAAAFQQASDHTAASATPVPVVPPLTTKAAAKAAAIPAADAAATISIARPPRAAATPAAPLVQAPTPPAPPVPAPPPRAPTPAWVLAAKKWLFSGNLVAKLGLLILFIGVSFLLKYAAERVTVPIELRLAGIVIADIALLVWGWRIRDTRRGISLPVQGAALGILMLVTFGAFRIYHLIPSGLAFGLLFALTFFTCLLAVLQNAIWLAVFGISGGFLAPIMTSTGQGSHIALFSYYTLLNAGILGIALKRSWRALNLLGFAFTFIIGTAWGVLRYAPENYLSTQLFLIVFVIFYVAIAIAYAARQAPALKNYVDATLVFGVPLVAFGLQFGLVEDTRFGVAFSALGLGLFYTALALGLWRRGGKNFKLLVESFLALGLVFGTLALPFALDGRWTSAAWALEGAGVVWVGLRQRQALTCMFGLLVQVGAWISFIATISGIDGSAEAANANLWLGFLLLTGTAFLMATNFRSRRGDLPAPLTWAAEVFLTVAAVWLLAGAWIEVLLRTSGSVAATLLAASALGASLLLGFIARRMQWKLASTLALIVQLLAGVVLSLLTAYLMLDLRVTRWNLFDTPFLGALIIFGGAIFSSWAMRRYAPDAYPRASTAMLVWSAVWWFVPVLVILSSWLNKHYEAMRGVATGDVSGLAIYGVALALSALAFAAASRRLAWPLLRYLGMSSWAGLLAAILLILGQLYAGNPIGIEAGIALAALWLTSEYLMRRWPRDGWNIGTPWIWGMHTVRSAGPWLMIWPAGANAVSRWLYDVDSADQLLLAQAGWQTSGSWARYIPAWLMMLAIVWLIGRARADAWPTTPVARWYRGVLIPLATAWSLLLASLWNLTQDGAMAPLPYLPLLNPLDLTSGFAMLLAVVCYRMRLADDSDGRGRLLLAKVPVALAWAAYAWFNLMLLRTAAHYLGIPYRFDPLFDSQFIQAMLSLVWSISALVLMWRAAKQVSRPQWVVGAVLLGLVVGKLFLVDLSNVGGVARIISFVGVGLLMVLIGYIAPFPTQQETPPEETPA